MCELAFLKAAKSYSKGPYKGCLALFVVGASQGWMLLAHESFKPALALPLILTTRVHPIKRKYFNFLCSWCCLQRPQKLKYHMFFDVGSGGGGCRHQKSMWVFLEFCCRFRKYQLYKNLSLKIEKAKGELGQAPVPIPPLKQTNINRSQNIGRIFHLCLPQLCLDSSLGRVLLKIRKCVENSWCLNFPSRTLVWTAQSHYFLP